MVKTAGAPSAKLVRYTLSGWYTPGGDEPPRGKCVVRDCEGTAVFHLCQNHAASGIVTVSEEGEPCVISSWVVEEHQRVQLFSIYDYSLGVDFGGRTRT